MSHGTHRIIALSIALAVVAPLSAHAREQARQVKHCGVTIKANNTGKLVKDVSCGARCTTDENVACSYDVGQAKYVCPLAGSSCTPEQIELGRNATLDLNGFGLTAATGTAPVECSSVGNGSCTVRGPGTIVASTNLAVRGHAQNVFLRDLTIEHSRGVKTEGQVVANNVTMAGCDKGFASGKRMRLSDVTLDAGCDVSTGKDLFVEHLEGAVVVKANGNVHGKDVFLHEGWVEARDVFLTNLHAPVMSSNALSISTRSVRATGRVVLRDSLVSEIQAAHKPTLVDSTCRTSRNLAGTATWGVCVRD
jgi:hypothetical protein